MNSLLTQSELWWNSAWAYGWDLRRRGRHCLRLSEARNFSTNPSGDETFNTWTLGGNSMSKVIWDFSAWLLWKSWGGCRETVQCQPLSESRHSTNTSKCVHSDGSRSLFRFTCCCSLSKVPFYCSGTLRGDEDKQELCSPRSLNGRMSKLGIIWPLHFLSELPKVLQLNSIFPCFHFITYLRAAIIWQIMGWG